MNGWIGLESVVLDLLVELHADKVEGRFTLHGPGAGPCTFLGQGGELLLDGSETFSVGGEPRNLVDALGAAGRGMRVSVIS